MVKVHEVLSNDGFSVPLRLHNLLLALAGRIDDTALSEARELIARAHIDEAVELITGTLIAGRIRVCSAEQRELAVVLEMGRSDCTLANELIVEDYEPSYVHRFSGENLPELGVADALDRALQVLPDVRSVHAVWRSTPAGSVSGPLPQRLMLVEVGSDGNPPAVAFRIDTALRRAGIRAVIEVSSIDTPRTDYHRAAGMNANVAWVAASAPMSSVEPFRPEWMPEFLQEPPVAVNAGGPSRPGLPFVVEQTEVVTPARSAALAGPIIPLAQKKGSVETRAERTSEMSSDEVRQLRQALAEDPEKGRELVADKPSMHEVVELPALDLDDPNLSESDRALLRELHAELAERERPKPRKFGSTARLAGPSSEVGPTAFLVGR